MNIKTTHPEQHSHTDTHTHMRSMENRIDEIRNSFRRKSTKQEIAHNLHHNHFYITMASIASHSLNLSLSLRLSLSYKFSLDKIQFKIQVLSYEFIIFDEFQFSEKLKNKNDNSLRFEGACVTIL